MSELSIRTARTFDWKRVRELCCLTGNSGDPIEESRWPFFGEFWVGPYQKLRPEWTYVATEPDQEPVGYLTGCPDTAAFEREKFFRFTLPLMARVGLRRFEANADAMRFIRRTLKREESPEDRFGAKVIRDIRRDYPAHLHMNLDAACRGKGVGRKLFERYCDDLGARGVKGVHLFCGAKPIQFYEAVGFKELARIEFRPGVWVYSLGASVS